MGILDRLQALASRQAKLPTDDKELVVQIAALSGQPVTVVEKALRGYSKGPRVLLRELEAGRTRIDRTGKVWLKDPSRKSVQATVKGVERGIWGRKS